MRVTLVVLLCLFSSASIAQDYVDYQRIVSRSNVDILDSNFNSALRRLDTLNHRYDFIYVSHCIKGLQLGYLTGDEVRANNWLKRSIIQGAPLWALRKNAITAQAIS